MITRSSLLKTFGWTTLVLMIALLAPGFGAVVSVLTHGNLEGVDVMFSTAPDTSKALDKANYSLAKGLTSIPIAEVTQLSATEFRVKASVPAGNVYTLTINNIEAAPATPVTVDQTSPSVINTTPSTYTFVQSHGLILRNIYRDQNGQLQNRVNRVVAGENPSILTNDFDFQGAPSLTDFRPYLENPDRYADFFGGQFKGYVTAPITGSYIFYFEADDVGALFFSLDENPANKQQIIAQPVFSQGYRNYGLVSSPIQLEAGKRYYIEAAFKDYNGGDHLAVAWQKPGDRPVAPGDLPIGPAYLSAYGYSYGAVQLKVAPPADITVKEGETVTLRFAAEDISGAPRYTYQWLRNGEPIPGANELTYVFSPSLADNGAQYSFQASNRFSQASQLKARLTVKPFYGEPPQVTLSASGTLLVITWPEEARGFTLQSTDSLIPPVGWSDVSDSSNLTQVEVPMEGPQKFFRLIRF